MITETEDLRAQLQALQARYDDFATEVYRQSSAIYGRCSNAKGAAAERKASQAAEMAAILMTTAQATRHQNAMEAEVSAGDYDLAALQVDVTTASNSECPFEDE